MKKYSDKLTRARKTQRRKIDAQDIQSIAKLVSKGLSESEACRRLEIEPANWFNFKHNGKDSARFAAILEKAKAERIEGLISEIENIGHGVGMKQKDWRALDRVLQITEKRFNDRASDESKNTSIQVSIFAGSDVRGIAARVYGESPLIGLPEQPKQLPAGAAGDEQQKTP